MKTITKSLDMWLNFLTNLNNLLKKYDHNIYNKALNYLTLIKEGKLTYLNEEAYLLNLCYDLLINDVDTIILFINNIKHIYSFDTTIKELQELKEKYNITDLALIIEESNKKQINTYFNQDFYRLAYFPNNVIPYEKIDFNSHGLTNLIFEGDYPFIIDERNLNTNKGNRTFYTSNFILNYHNFPKKEEMDLINIKYKRDKIFEQLLYSLISFNNTYLTIKNPNETYYNPFELNLNKRFTIRSDGHSYLDNNEPLKPDKKYLESSKVIIENANFVLIAMITNNEINSLNLIISDSYYKYLLDNNLKIIEILNLIPKTKENIILNLNNF